MAEGGGRLCGHMAGVGVCGRGSSLWHEWGHVAGEGTYGSVWGYVAGCGHMWHGVGQGVGECGVGSGLWHRLGHVAGLGHMVGCGGM